MSKAARTIFAFGLYLCTLGCVLLATPNTLLAILKLPLTTEVLGLTPAMIVLFGIVDALGALWTAVALRAAASP